MDLDHDVGDVGEFAGNGHSSDIDTAGAICMMKFYFYFWTF